MFELLHIRNSTLYEIHTTDTLDELLSCNNCSFEDEDSILLQTLALYRENGIPKLVGHYFECKGDLIYMITHLETGAKGFFKRIQHDELSAVVEEIGSYNETADCGCLKLSGPIGYVQVHRWNPRLQEHYFQPLYANLRCKICEGTGFKHRIINGHLI